MLHIIILMFSFEKRRSFDFICRIVNVKIKSNFVFPFRKDRYKNLMFLFFIAGE